MKTMKLLPGPIDTHRAINLLVNACHNRAWNAGWWHDLNTGEFKKKPEPEVLMLIVTELAEAMEGFRKDLNDDKLPHRKMFEVELADAVIRICDAAGGYGLDLAGAIVEKMEYNAHRADHKIENRLADGGKKI